MSRRSNAFGVGILTLPAWADYTALPNGKFIEFTLNTPNDAQMQRATLMNWCGGVMVPDYGARGGVCYHGGGEHSLWTDSRADGGPGQNGVYVLDCDTRTYIRKCYPTADYFGFTGLAGSPTDDWGAYTADINVPQAKHTYSGTSYRPASWGGGPQGCYMRVSHAGGISQSRGPNPTAGNAYEPGLAATWQFDLSKAAHTPANPSILKLTGSSVYDYGKVPNTDYAGRPGATINNSPFACIDTIRQGWWSTHTAGNGWGGKMAFTSKTGVITGPFGQVGFSNETGLHHFADDDIVIALTDGQLDNAIETEWQVYVWQAGTSSGWVRAPLTRQNITDTRIPPNNTVKAYVGINAEQPRWSTLLGAFVWIDSQYPIGAQPTTTIRVWKLTPPPAGQRFTGTWSATWELVSAKAGTESANRMNMLNGDVSGDAATVQGTYGRFIECPSLRAFVWTRDINKPGQLIRLQGM